MYGYYGYDTLFLAVIVVFILGIWAQIRVKNTYKKYSQEYASSGITAANMAERMLSEHGSSVQVTMIPGSLTDNYNPPDGAGQPVPGHLRQHKRSGPRRSGP